MGQPSSIARVLRLRAQTQPNALAFAFRPDRGDGELRVTFGELDARASAVARELVRAGQPQDRVALLFPAGLDFIAAFFGCLYAGRVAVPLPPPRRMASRDSSAGILADCEPSHVLTLSSMLEDLRPELAANLTCGRTAIRLDGLAVGAEFDLRAPGELAVLQYTSGSTGSPKGVMVSNANIMANLEMVRGALAADASSVTAGWLPFHHDMGLVMTVLHPVYLGAACVLSSPAAFLHRPLKWLWAIHEHRAQLATAPNFAFDLCVERFRPEAVEGLDLSSWRVAQNGAEPVRADTLERFARTFAPYGFEPSSFHPGYGLAEATLMVTGRGCENGLRVGAGNAVSCGPPVAGASVAVVDHETRLRLPAGEVGEVWVSGAAVAQGYWRKPVETEQTFGAEIAGEPGRRWLRTGDLGFLHEDGELFVTGRLKDLIIVRGANHYPQDIEATVQAAHPALKRGSGVAFLAPDSRGEDRLVIVQEVDRNHRRDFDAAAAADDIREAVSREHELSVHDVMLIRQGALPLTTSGKLRRRHTRQLWIDRKLDLDA